MDMILTDVQSAEASQTGAVRLDPIAVLIQSAFCFLPLITMMLVIAVR
jgi:hypothetical protein